MAKYLFYGQDRLRKREALSLIEKKFNQRYSSINIDQLNFDRGQISAQELQAKLQTIPFLGTKRLIIAYYPFSSLDSKARKQRETLIEQFSSVPASTNLIIIETALKKSSLPRTLREKGFSLKEFKPIYGFRFKNWLIQRAKQYDLTINSQAADLLIDYLGDSSGRIDQELKKLRDYLSFHHQKEITTQDIRTTTSPVPNLAIFDLLDKVAGQNFSAASLQLEEMLNQGVSESYLLSMLETTISNLLQAKDYKERAKDISAQVLQKKFGWHPFVAQKVFKQFDRFDKKSLIQIYQRLLETEYKIKSGYVKPRLQLTLLLGQL